MLKVKAKMRRQGIESRRQNTEGTRQKAMEKGLSFLAFFAILLTSLCVAGEQVGKPEVPKGTEGIWDPNKYISLDEIKPGMQAYCLTEYGSAGVEKFGMEVIDVVCNIDPGRDAILVKGTDERFVRTGPVAGCSGSPVYIEGRLAGALAFAWAYSKDPLYGATPIEEMLKVGQGTTNKEPLGSWGSSERMGFVFDFSRAIDFSEIDRQITTPRFSKNNSPSGAAILPCLLITPALPAEAYKQLSASVEPLGLMVVCGVGGSIEGKGLSEQSAGGSGKQEVKLLPGACLAVPLVSGDITMSVFGTVTEVRGDNVYGFGHSFLGYGPVDLPMATGRVHTVVSSLLRSFKVASIVETVGALTVDEGAAVFGQIGAKTRTFPMVIRIERYNAPKVRIYNCQVANNRLLTPAAMRATVAAAAYVVGDFPPDHTVEYKVTIGLDGFEPIIFENVSTGLGIAEVVAESGGAVAILMNNPYKKVDIKSMDFDVKVAPKDITSHLWSVDLSDLEVKAGDQIQVGVVVESVLAGKKRYPLSLKIPKSLAPGKYELTVCGAQDYEQFLRKVVPYRFIGQNLPDLIDALNNTLRIDKSRLYCVLSLPPGGVTVEEAELPDLPATKALVLQNAKRSIRSQPYQHWLENSLKTGTIIIDKKVLQITVKEWNQK
jgi:hypothetical protein